MSRTSQDLPPKDKRRPSGQEALKKKRRDSGVRTGAKKTTQLKPSQLRIQYLFSQPLCTWGGKGSRRGVMRGPANPKNEKRGNIEKTVKREGDRLRENRKIERV